MVQKGRIRNEWVDAHLADGDLSEVPQELVEEVKALAKARQSSPKISVEAEVFPEYLADEDA